MKKVEPDLNDQTVRGIIFVSETTDEEEQLAWNKITAEQFLDGYNEADSIYDEKM